tara:strand:- start:1052 stop:1363 length:312 start_codon:yes stop_codon:yes gene_type:complete
MKITKYFCTALIIISPLSMALPRVAITFGESLNGFARVKIKNETFEPLACFVAIDGQKTKFQLLRKSTSPWITTTDKRFNFQNFSTWCDYLEIHPKYKAYRAY